MLLHIPWDVEGLFVERPNRFLGIVEVGMEAGAEKVKVHVHDPGRLPDILTPGNRVRLKHVRGRNRKTEWDLIAGKNDGDWILVHSGYHRRICEVLFGIKEISPFKGVQEVIPEVKVGKSRIDFLLKTEDGKEIWVEVKGCTLAEGKVATFPDAPTIRGTRHLEELATIKKDGVRAAVLFLVFRPETSCFLPNGKIDPKFSDAFWKALDHGVEAKFLVLEYIDSSMYFKKEIGLCDV